MHATVYGWLSGAVRQGSGHDAQILRSLLRLWLVFLLCAGSSELAVHSDVFCSVTLVFVDGFCAVMLRLVVKPC